MTVFLSYSRDDHAYARALAAHLSRAGIPLWWDHHLTVGDRFADRIQDQIDQCAAFVVILTPSAIGSSWVRDELHYALQADKPVLPLRLAPCRLPLRAAGLHVLDVTDGALPGEDFVTRLRSEAGLLPTTLTDNAGDLLRFLAELPQQRGGYQAADVVAGMQNLLTRISDPETCIGLLPPYFPFARWRGHGYPPADVDAFVLAHRPKPADFDHALRLLLADERLPPGDPEHSLAVRRLPGGWLAVTTSGLRFHLAKSDLDVPFADLGDLRLHIIERDETWVADAAAAGTTTLSRLQVTFRGRCLRTGEINDFTSSFRAVITLIQEITRIAATPLSGPPTQE